MRQGLLCLVCVERAAISDVAKRLFLDLLIAAVKPGAGCKRGTTGMHELRGHIAVLRLLPHRVKRCGAVNRLFDVGFQLPRADQAFAYSLCHHGSSCFACRCLSYAEVCASLSIGRT